MPAFHVAAGPIPGVKMVSRSASFPRPHVGILAALHGDEVCGLAVHERILEQANEGTLPFTEGTLLLIHGNVQAWSEGQRYTETGYDLNRICNLKFRDRLPKEKWGYEHHRAIELVPLLKTLDGAVDLHSASSPTEPFAVALPGAIGVARKLGLRWVTWNWDEASDIADGVALARVAERGVPVAAVECGQHRDTRAAEVGWSVVSRYLRAVGRWDRELEPIAEPPTILKVFLALPKKTEGFAFTKPLRGFEKIAEGQVIGSDGTIEMRAPADAYAVLPNDGVPLRKNVVYLAREESP